MTDSEEHTAHADLQAPIIVSSLAGQRPPLEFWWSLRLRHMMRMWLQWTREYHPELELSSSDSESEDEIEPSPRDAAQPGQGRGAQLWRRTRMAMAMVVGLPVATGVAVFDRTPFLALPGFPIQCLIFFCAQAIRMQSWPLRFRSKMRVWMSW